MAGFLYISVFRVLRDCLKGYSGTFCLMAHFGLVSPGDFGANQQDKYAMNTAGRTNTVQIQRASRNPTRKTPKKDIRPPGVKLQLALEACEGSAWPTTDGSVSGRRKKTE
jgi:hypothetical protein